jgi:hypothetical protein
MSRTYGMVAATVLALLVAGAPGSAQARHRRVAGKSAAAAKSAPKPEPKAYNACGCYADLSGKCTCGRRGKCECPGECEPKGCEEKRARQMQKEIAAETKKAVDADRKARQTERKEPAPPPEETKPKPKPADKDGVGQ